MEFMDRQHRTVLLQFWLVVNGFKNPLEDDDGDVGALSTVSSNTYSESDKEDIKQIYNSYFSDPALNIEQKYKDDIQRFVDNLNATSSDYQLARRAIMRAQKQVYDILEEKDLPSFKKSDIFLKYLTSTDHESENPKVTVDEYHVGLLDEALTDGPTIAENSNIDSEYMAIDRKSLDYDRDGLSISVEPEDDVVQAVQAAFDDIMQSRPVNATADDASSSKSEDSSSRAPPSTINEEYNPDTPSMLNDSPRSSIESPRPDTVDTAATTAKSSGASDIRSDLFGSTNVENENHIFPTESALFEETTREIFSEDALSSEDEMDAIDSDIVADTASIHRADPGDLGLTETIQHISDAISKLMNQDAVLESLLKKAELTNNIADLRILKKSKASVEREIRRKELQRQQYIVQESDNGLYVCVLPSLFYLFVLMKVLTE